MNLKNWWDNQSERDQRTLLIGSIVVLIAAFYYFIWSPLSTAAETNKKTVHDQQSLLLYLHSSAIHIQQLKSEGIVAAPVGTPPNLLTLVEQSLAQQQLSTYLKQVQQPKPTQINLTFNSVPFDNLMQWLQTLVTSQNISVTAFSADRDAKLGDSDRHDDNRVIMA